MITEYTEVKTLVDKKDTRQGRPGLLCIYTMRFRRVWSKYVMTRIIL